MNPPADPSFERILRAIDAARNSRQFAKSLPLLDAMRAYVITGDARILAAPAATAANYYHWWQWPKVFEALAAPDQLELADRRLLTFAHSAGMSASIQGWLRDALGKETSGPDTFRHAAQELAQLGWTPQALADLWGDLACFFEFGKAEGALESWFLALDEPARQDVMRRTLGIGYDYGKLLARCAKIALGSVRKFLDDEQASAVAAMWPHRWLALLEVNAALFEPDAVCALVAAKWPYMDRFSVAKALHEFAPERYRAMTIEKAREALRELSGFVADAAQWLVKEIGADILPQFVELMRLAPVQMNHNEYRQYLLKAASALGRAAAQPVCDAYLESAPLENWMAPIEQLLEWDEPDTRAQALAAIEAGLSAPKNPARLWYLGRIEDWMLPALEPRLWKLLEDSSKLTREAAAAVLAAHAGGAVIPRAAGLLAARRATTRLAAIHLLALLLGGEGSGVETPSGKHRVQLLLPPLGDEDANAARAALRARLDAETDEGVREALLKVFPDAAPAAAVAGNVGAPEAAPAPASRETIDALVARTADKFTGPPAPWLDESQLPALCLTGEPDPLPLAAVRFLLHRQARGKEIAADPQARPLLDAIDRARSGDFALAVLQGFLQSPQEAKDRWALAVAGLLGDGRSLRLLARQIPEWVDHYRGKLAEYAAEAISLLGSDEALLALDALAIRYRSKNKNVGAAASAAFAKAAEARGLTTDELGDRVVPWLGFPAEGGPRVVTVGERRIEVRVGLDFKPSLLDADARKKVASWPASTPPEIKAEMKEMTAALREAAKAQTLRMENQFVRQRRWPAARWRELFLAHPLLLPFAVQLVWGEYASASGNEGPRAIFRALPDGTLTDADDNAPALGPDAFVGAVHPLELDAETLRAWQTHLDDYEVEAPFAQMGRPVIRVAPEQAGEKSLADGAGAELSALTFKSRAEKRGWTRGSVVDAGGVSSYLKRFPGAGVDAFLELEGLFIGAGMDDTVTLGNVRFVRGGSVKTGSYTYDEPRDDQDARLIPLGDVPPVVFSETAGDVRIIAGRAQ